MAILVAFIGVDCAGKSTQAKIIADRYTSLGVRATSVGLTFKPTVKNLARIALELSPDGETFPFGVSGEHWATAYNCDFFNHYQENIRPLRDQPDLDVILSDRYTQCYKAFASAMRSRSGIAHTFLDLLVPPADLTVLFDLDLDTVLERLSVRSKEAAHDETPEILGALITYYRQLASEHSEIHTIDASRSLASVTDELFALIEKNR